MKWLKKFEEVKLKLKKVDAEGNSLLLETPLRNNLLTAIHSVSPSKIRINSIYDDDIRTGIQIIDWFKSPKKINKL